MSETPKITFLHTCQIHFTDVHVDTAVDNWRLWAVKPSSVTAFVVGEGAVNILAVVKPRRVTIPLFEWKELPYHQLLTDALHTGGLSTEVQQICVHGPDGVRFGLISSWPGFVLEVEAA